MTRHLLCIPALLVLLALMAPPASAGTITVPGDQPDLPTAVGVAIPGDLIQITDGSAQPGVTVATDNLTIDGMGTASVTGVGGGGVAGIEIAAAATSLTLRGLTITTGASGVQAANQVNLTIESCNINNNANNGVDVTGPGSVSITGGTISGNGMRELTVPGSANVTLSGTQIVSVAGIWCIELGSGTHSVSLGAGSNLQGGNAVRMNGNGTVNLNGASISVIAEGILIDGTGQTCTIDTGGGNVVSAGDNRAVRYVNGGGTVTVDTQGGNIQSNGASWPTVWLQSPGTFNLYLGGGTISRTADQPAVLVSGDPSYIMNVYLEGGLIDATGFTFGVNSWGETTINGPGTIQGATFSCVNNAAGNLTLDGVTVQGGIHNIYQQIVTTGDLTVRNCLLRNSAGGQGIEVANTGDPGWVYPGTLTVTSTTITNCASGISGYANGTWNITACNISANNSVGINTVTNGSSVQTPALTVTDCTIENNVNAGINADTNMDLTVVGGVIRNNGGPAIRCAGTGYSIIDATNVTMTGNATGAWGWGTINLWQQAASTVTLTGCTADSAAAGGGIGYSSVGNATLNLVNSTVNGNSGQGIVNGVTGDLTLTASGSQINGNTAHGILYTGAGELAISLTDSDIALNGNDGIKHETGTSTLFDFDTAGDCMISSNSGNGVMVNSINAVLDFDLDGAHFDGNTAQMGFWLFAGISLDLNATNCSWSNNNQRGLITGFAEPIPTVAVFDNCEILGGASDGWTHWPMDGNTLDVTLIDTTIANGGGDGLSIHRGPSQIELRNSHVDGHAGKGIFCANTGSLSLTTSTVNNNGTNGLDINGGTAAISIVGSSVNGNASNIVLNGAYDVTVDNSTFNNNGGVSLWFTNAGPYTLDAQDSVWDGNPYGPLMDGAGTYTLRNCTIRNNNTQGFRNNTLPSLITMEECTLSNNPNNSVGYLNPGSNLVMSTCTVTDSARLAIVGAQATLTDCTFSGSSNDDRRISIEQGSNVTMAGGAAGGPAALCTVYVGDTAVLVAEGVDFTGGQSGPAVLSGPGFPAVALSECNFVMTGQGAHQARAGLTTMTACTTVANPTNPWASRLTSFENGAAGSTATVVVRDCNVDVGMLSYVSTPTGTLDIADSRFDLATTQTHAVFFADTGNLTLNMRNVDVRSGSTDYHFLQCVGSTLTLQGVIEHSTFDDFNNAFICGGATTLTLDQCDFIGDGPTAIWMQGSSSGSVTLIDSILQGPSLFNHAPGTSTLLEDYNVLHAGSGSDGGVTHGGNSLQDVDPLYNSLVFSHPMYLTIHPGSPAATLNSGNGPEAYAGAKGPSEGPNAVWNWSIYN